MEQALLDGLKEGGVGIALVVVVALFMKYISGRDKLADENNKAFLLTIQNHMAHENESFTKMTDANQQQTAAMREMQEYFRNLNGQLKHRKKR